MLHFWFICSRLDRPCLKYPFINFDILLLHLAIAYSPPIFNVPIADAGYAGRALDCAEFIVCGVAIPEFAVELL